MAAVYVVGTYDAAGHFRRAAIVGQPGCGFADGVTRVQHADISRATRLTPPTGHDRAPLPGAGIWYIAGSDAAIAAIKAFCDGNAAYAWSATEPAPDAAWDDYPGWSDSHANTYYPMVGDESFHARNLSAAAQVWHGRLVAMDVTQLPVYTNAATATDDTMGLEVIGEALLFTITPLVCAFRLTGDLAILDMIDTLMQQAKVPLIDKGYFLSVSHMAHSGVSCLLNQLALCYALNAGNISPDGVDYAARAAQWQTYIDSTYYPAKGLPTDNLRHRNAAGLRGMYYYWRWQGALAAWRTEQVISGAWKGGFDGYRAYFQAANRTDVNPDTPTPEPGLWLEGDRYAWNHEVPFPWGTAYYFVPQPTNYAQYVMASLMDLALEGVAPWTDLEMLRYAKTAEFVLADGLDHIRNDVNTTETGSYWAAKMINWALLGMGRWSATIAALGDTVWAIPYGLPKVITAAWMLVATAG